MDDGDEPKIGQECYSEQAGDEYRRKGERPGAEVAFTFDFVHNYDILLQSAERLIELLNAIANGLFSGKDSEGSSSSKASAAFRAN